MMIFSKNINSGDKKNIQSVLSTLQVYQKFQTNITEAKKAYDRNKYYQALGLLIKNIELLFVNNNTAELNFDDLVELFKLFNNIQQAVVVEGKISDIQRFDQILTELAQLTVYYGNDKFLSCSILIKELFELKLVSIKPGAVLRFAHLQSALDYFFKVESYLDLVVEKETESLEDNWIYGEYLDLINEITEVFNCNQEIEDSLNGYFKQFEARVKKTLLSEIALYQEKFVAAPIVVNMQNFLKPLGEFICFGFDRPVRPMVSTVYWLARSNNLKDDSLPLLASIIELEILSLPAEKADWEFVELGSITVENKQEFFYKKISNVEVRDFFLEFMDLEGKALEQIIEKLNKTDPTQYRIGEVFIKLLDRLLALRKKTVVNEAKEFIKTIETISNEELRREAYFLFYAYAPDRADYDYVWQILNDFNSSLEEKYIRWLFYLSGKISYELAKNPFNQAVIEAASLNLKKISPAYIEGAYLDLFFKLRENIELARKRLKKQLKDNEKNNTKHKSNKKYLTDK